MSDGNKATSQGGAPILTDAEHQQVHQQLASDKGKGKAADAMDMDDDSSSDEEEQVRCTPSLFEGMHANSSAQNAPGMVNKLAPCANAN